MLNKDKKYFVPNTDVSEGKDGDLFWAEADDKGGLVWFSKPVSCNEVPPDAIVEKAVN